MGLRWLAERYLHSVVAPRYLVRKCRSRAQLLGIVNQVLVGGQPWSDDLVDEVVEAVIGEGGKLSVFAAATSCPVDVGHALAVMASTISSSDFDLRQKKKSAEGVMERRKNTTSCGTLVLRVREFDDVWRRWFSPENNLDFCPADGRHFDIEIADAKQFARRVLDGIKSGEVPYALLRGEKTRTYNIQAGIVCSYVATLFGRVDPEQPPRAWKHGHRLSAKEQIRRLHFLGSLADLVVGPG